MFWRVSKTQVGAYTQNYLSVAGVIVDVGGSSKIRTLSHDSSSIKIEIYSNGKDSQVNEVTFLHLQMNRHITNYILPSGC